MQPFKTKTLAIAPITKRFGVAVFENTELVYFAVTTVKSNKIAQSLKIRISQTIRKLIGEFEPNFTVVKLLNKQQEKSRNLKLAVRQIQAETKIVRIPLGEVSFDLVKKSLCAGSKPTKANSFAILADFYPELRQFLHQSNRWQKEYYDAMLSAVAIGFYCQNDILRRNLN